MIGQVNLVRKQKSGVSKYRPEYAEQARHLCKLGATDEELAEAFSVTPATIRVWRATQQGFRAATSIGRDQYTERVMHRLAARAIGYTYETEEVFCYKGRIIRTTVRKHMPPSVEACIFWLKNREPALWGDVQRIEHTGPGGSAIKHELRQLDDDTLLQIEKMYERAVELHAKDVTAQVQETSE